MAFSSVWNMYQCCDQTPRISHDSSALKLYATLRIEGYWYSRNPELLTPEGNTVTTLDFFANFNDLSYRYRIFIGPVDICRSTFLLMTTEDIMPRVTHEESGQTLVVTRILRRSGKTLWKIRGCGVQSSQ